MELEEEIQMAMKDVSFGVKTITCDSPHLGIFKIVTLENLHLTVSISLEGYKVTEQDGKIVHSGAVFESLSSLLFEYSPEYQEAFHSNLLKKLAASD